MGYIVGDVVKKGICEYCGDGVKKCCIIHFTNDKEVEYNTQTICHDCIQGKLTKHGTIVSRVKKQDKVLVCPKCGSGVMEKIVYVGVNLTEVELKEFMAGSLDEAYCKKCRVKSG